MDFILLIASTHKLTQGHQMCRHNEILLFLESLIEVMIKEIDLFKNKIKQLFLSGLGGGTRCGVHVLRGYLRCDFNNPRFVDDPGCAVALLHNPNNPCLVAFTIFGGLYLCTEASCLLPWQTDQQASWQRKRRGYYVVPPAKLILQGCSTMGMS